MDARPVSFPRLGLTLSGALILAACQAGEAAPGSIGTAHLALAAGAGGAGGVSDAGGVSAGGVATGTREDGASCQRSGQCASGHCVDGVCCDRACTGTCQACSARLKASREEDGVCGVALGGTDPHADCRADDATSCGQTGKCNGRGACQLFPLGTSCGTSSCDGQNVSGEICDGDGTCFTTAVAQAVACAPYLCIDDGCVRCTRDSECTGRRICIGGTCHERFSAGAACETATQCASNFCVDGVCCGSACTGRCQACNVAGREGTCTIVRGDPVAPREPCAGSGDCAGTCAGAAECTFPESGVTCAAPTCDRNTLTPAGTCDGAGSCTTPAALGCGPYACDADRGQCASRCTTDGDCASGARCNVAEQACTTEFEPTCQDSFTAVDPAGTELSCSPYRCQAGRCRDRCEGPADCTADHDCTGSRCVPHTESSGGASAGGAGTDAPPAPDGEGAGESDSGGCGCRVRERPGGTSWAWVLALLAASVGRRRAHRQLQSSGVPGAGRERGLEAPVGTGERVVLDR